ncbi:hypothetical protein ERX46_07880 [Brumimicrobium glaciale]|jgi:GLPGLI family protein|uniref:DUF4412 domain-containing protein n=1 Tax=Brumimicrobium glaciale TaxID=200475 RepID=A0A4Q4KKI0_9FLAO|nr:hypothetical protein [Brumimicrobium glaciale]RYM33873.1 hypothetical protein ERX46_07880 [Brumimicrobium glaciale]
MKVTALFITFLLLLNFSFAQEMKIKYDISMKSNDPEMQAQLQMIEGSSLTVFVKDALSRTEMNMGGLMKTTTILDVEKKKGLMLMDGMLGKQAAPFGGTDFDKYKSKENDSKIEYTDETRVILGYKCKKAVMYMEEDNVEMTFWYTENLKTSKAYLGEYSKFGIPGVALEYGIEQSDVTMKFVAVELKTSLNDVKGLFNLNVPAGYTEKSFKEISNMSGQ